MRAARYTRRSTNNRAALVRGNKARAYGTILSGDGPPSGPPAPALAQGVACGGEAAGAAGSRDGARGGLEVPGDRYEEEKDVSHPSLVV